MYVSTLIDNKLAVNGELFHFYCIRFTVEIKLSMGTFSNVEFCYSGNKRDQANTFFQSIPNLIKKIGE